MAIPPLILRIYADSSGVKAGVASAQKSVGGMKGFMKQNAALIGVALAGGVAAFGVASVKAFNESEAAIAQTNAVLKSTKGIAGVTAAEVTNLATQMQSLTKFSDEEVRSAENLLLTFTNIGQSIFPETTRAVLDMSTALGQDLKSSSIQLGKALNDPILGLTSLGRVGVKFTEQTRARIKALVEEGTTLAAQKIILKELATEFGGSATAAAKTFAGQMAQLKNRVNDLMEQFGKIITQVGSKFLPAVDDAIGRLESLGGAVATAVDKLGFLKPVWDKATEGASLFDNALTDAVPGMSVFNQILDSLPGSSDKVTMSQEELTEAFDRGTVAGQSVLKQLFGLGKGADETGDKVNKMGKNFRRVGTTVGRFATSTKKEWREFAVSAAENFDAVKGALDTLAGKAKVTANKIITAFNRQATAIAHYRDNLETVKNRNIPDAVLQQLLTMGQEGAGIMAELAGASDKKFRQIVGAMQRAQTQSNRLLGDLRALREEANRGILVNVRFQQTDLPNLQQRASGGPVDRMRPYIVGERGPELFVPKTAGTIVPNKGGGTNTGSGRVSVSIDRRRWVREADYEVAYGGA